MGAYLYNLWSEKKKSFLTVALLIVIILLGARYIQKVVRGFQSPDVRGSDIQILKSVNIQQLTVYSLLFEVITRVSETEEGAISVQLLSGELLGKDTITEILYRGCLKLRYGIDIPELTDQHYQLNADTIKITLPPPHVIGLPQLVTTDDCATDVIDTRSSNWVFSPETRNIVKYTRIELQEKLPEWVRQYGFNEKAQDRTEQVLKDLFESHFPNRGISISFDDSE